MKHMIIVVVAICCAAAVAEAQQGTTDLRGRTVDAQQGTMPGVTVVLRNQESGISRETTSSSDGTFFFSALIPGVYQVEATLQGFKTYMRSDMRLEVGRGPEIEIPMEIGGIEESVTVRAEAPLVDTSSAEIGGRVGSQDFLDTPSMNRDFTGFLSLLPGVVSQAQTTTFGAAVSAGGQDTRNVNFALDGSNNNDAMTSGSQGSQARIPVEAVQEFTLLTGQFDAEFGNTSGSFVNAVSKSGTNVLHGSAFGFFQDHNLSTNDFFAKQRGLEQPPTKQAQFGGTLGGPIVQDRAHFFGSVERIVLDQGMTTIIPSRPDLNRTDYQLTRVWNIFAKVDQQLTPNNSWGIRYLRDSSPQPIQLNPEWTRLRAGEEKDVDSASVGNLSSVLGATTVNTFRVSYTSEILDFANPAYIANGYVQNTLLPQLNYPSFSDGQSATANLRRLRGITGENVMSLFMPNKAGDHELKFGLSYNYTWVQLVNNGNENGTFTFSNDLAFDPLNPRTYPERFSIRVPGVSDFKTKAHFMGGFVQDKWKMGDRLTMSLGARYDLEVFHTPNSVNPMFEGLEEQAPVDGNNIAPRLGFTYALDGSGRSVVRGGFGLFYQITSLTFLLNTFTDGRNSNSFETLSPLNNIDPGPRNGQFPTNPFLRNYPNIDRSALEALFPPGSDLRNVGTVRFDNPDRKNAWSRQYSLGYETQLSDSFAVSVDFIRSEQRDQYMTLELNPPLRSTGLATGSISRTNPLAGDVGEFVGSVTTLANVGSIDYNSLQVAATKRLSSGFSSRVSYAFSRARGTSGTGQADAITSQFLDDLRLDGMEGPTNADRTHILSVSGNWDVPKTGGLKVSGVLQSRSGTPFSLINSTFDADQNGLTTNEYLAPGTYSGVGRNAITVDYEGGRNGARGPGYVSLDLRGGYRVRLPGGRTVDAFVDVFNVTDHVNYVNPAADLRTASSFLVLTGTQGATRTAQINVRYGF